MSFPFAPPPPDCVAAGPSDAVAATLLAHVAAEGRRSWTSASSALLVTDDGRAGARHYPLARLEEGGMRGLLTHFRDCFPRATPLCSRLSAPTFAAVWRELFEPDDGEVRVGERCGAVYAVSPPSYPTDYDVSHLVRDVCALLTVPVPAMVRYDAGACEVVLVLGFGGYNVEVKATDTYDGGGVEVHVVTRAGVDLGDPLPGLRSRRREGGDTVVAGVGAKLRAAGDFYLQHKGKV